MHGKLYKETFVYRKIVKDKVKYIDLFDDSIYTKTGISSCENVGEVYIGTNVLIPYNALLYSLDIEPKKNTDKKMIKKMKKLIYERRNINSEKNI